MSQVDFWLMLGVWVFVGGSFIYLHLSETKAEQIRREVWGKFLKESGDEYPR